MLQQENQRTTMTPAKVQGIWNSRYASQIIRNKLARRFYGDRGTFHQMVSAVDSMKSYFEQLEAIVSDPLLRKQPRCYQFRARQEAASAREKAEAVLGTMDERELAGFSSDALGIAHTDELVYQRAVNYLFDTYKIGKGPHGEWKPVPKDDSRLNILQSIDGLLDRYSELRALCPPWSERQ